VRVTHDLSGVLAESLCIGCGACAMVDRTVELRLDPRKLIYEPSHASGPAAAAVCPAVQVDFAGLQTKLFPGQTPSEYGVVHSVMLAQSVDVDRNTRASSGGLIKELLLHHLAQPDVDGAIALSHVGGLDFQPRLITRPDEVDTLPGSIYHNLAQPRAIELLEQHEGRFVLVAIPCQLEGIFQYIYNHAPHLRERIHSTIGLLCGWQYSHHALKAICEFKGMDFDTITDVSYRGGGPVGKLRISTPKKTVAVSRRVDFGYQVAFDRTFNTPRCHLCINHSNFLADIVVGDAWLPSTVMTKTGISLLINRTAAADATVRSLAADGRLKIADVTLEEIKESQTRRVIFGDFAYAYAEHLERLGVHVPDMVGPNRAVAKLADDKDVTFFRKELLRKLELQWAGRYRYLWARKATKELRRFLGRYVEWFLVRVVKIKSLLGHRKEVSKETISIFK
jgi:coenzyme F420-reducing hydrogenase beta subunit